MKFILVMSICSFVNSQCLSPAQIEGEYDSWKKCTIAALEISKKLIISQEDVFVNDDKIATKFMCQEVGEKV